MVDEERHLSHVVAAFRVSKSEGLRLVLAADRVRHHDPPELRDVTSQMQWSACSRRRSACLRVDFGADVRDHQGLQAHIHLRIKL